MTTPDLGRDPWLFSPGSAFHEQARMERTIGIEASAAAVRFLTRVRERATFELTTPSAAFIQEQWRTELSESLPEALIPVAAQEYVLASFMASTLPDDVWQTLRAVFATAGTEAWTSEQTRREVRAALRLDTGTMAPEPPTLIAAGLVDMGMSWLARIRRDVRTSATGLFGWTSQAALQVTGVPYKRWVARHDSHTRDTHAAADGQTVPVTSVFTVGNTSLSHPGERGGSPEETINCRCVMVGVLRSA